MASFSWYIQKKNQEPTDICHEFKILRHFAGFFSTNLYDMRKCVFKFCLTILRHDALAR